MTANQETCQKCGSPLRSGMKFCESCGAKIEALPACPQCGVPVAPNAKFCESCGAPVNLAAPAVVAPVTATVVPAPDTASPVQKTRPMIEPPVKAEEKTVPIIDKKPVPLKGEEPPKPEKAKEMPKETRTKKPIPQQTMIIAGIIVLALLGAAVYFVVLPMLSGPGISSQNQQVSTGPTGPGSSSGTPSVPADTSQSGAVSFIPGPTDVPPFNRAVVVDVERDAITSIITVTFQGGEGQYGVRELAVTLTRSDGTIEKKSFKPEFRGTSTTLQGTQKTDRVEVTANFYNGETYKIIDQIFEYKKRGG